jgi:hypothetical protein
MFDFSLAFRTTSFVYPTEFFFALKKIIIFIILFVIATSVKKLLSLAIRSYSFITVSGINFIIISADFTNFY